MHLVTSFTKAESDSMAHKDFWKFERRISAAIGCEDHARIVVVQVDTAHRHMHIDLDLLAANGRYNAQGRSWRCTSWPESGGSSRRPRRPPGTDGVAQGAPG